MKKSRQHLLSLWIVTLLLSSTSLRAFVAVRLTPLPTSLERTQYFCPTALIVQCRQSGTTASRLESVAPSSSSSSSSASEIRDQLGLHDRFDRWRFLQNMLDGDISANDTQLVLMALLNRFLLDRPVIDPAGSSDDAATATGSPVLTRELRERIESVLRSLVQSARALPDLLAEDEHETTTTTKEALDIRSSSSSSAQILNQLELLLPDPVEDEDAFKSLWDTIIELHGRESVKINERNASIQWKARCLIARVLLHFDFLTHGLVDDTVA